MGNKIKVAIIGVGGISNEHIKGYLALPDEVELYAFCDINEKTLKEKGEKYGIKRLFTDYNEMLKDEAIDAVSVCTWNSEHAPATIAALNAGKNVLCEKPMAVTAEDAQRMQDAAEKNGKLLQIGFVRRYGNDCKIVKEFIENGDLGDIYYSKATYLRRDGCPGGWFSDKSRSGGGPLIDLGVHVIDLVRYLMGNPEPVSVYGATFQKLLDRPGINHLGRWTPQSAENEEHIFDVEDLASVMIRFDGGQVLHIEAAFSLNIKEDEGTIQLFGTKGGVKLDPDVEIFSDWNKHLVNTTFAGGTSIDFENIFQREIAHFVDCVKTGKKTIAPAEDGVKLMKILNAAYKSAETGHEVIL